MSLSPAGWRRSDLGYLNAVHVFHQDGELRLDHGGAQVELGGGVGAGADLPEAAGLGARLDLATVPVMDGALALVEAGVRSSIWQENRDGAGEVTGAAGARGELIFDPQTCGGLLAAVSPETADTVLGRLKDAGYEAARIGSLCDGSGIGCA